MNKTVLFLINGFGIEKKDSYSIYDENLLPTLDRLMKTNLYSSIESKASDYTSGYKLFSIGSANTSNYSYINELIENNKLFENPNLKLFNDANIGKETKIHIFMNLENDEVIESLNKFVKALKIDVNRIVIHFILNQKSLTEYKTIINRINNFTFSGFRSSNIGFVFGENCLNDPAKIEDLKTIGRVMFNSKSGEAWLEYSKKLTNLFNSNVLPINVPPFCVNDNFTIQDNEVVLFFNFDGNNYDSLINTIVNPPINYKTVDTTTLTFYSLFPLNTQLKIINLLDNVKADYFMADYLEKTNLNALILAEQKDINNINYMANGLNNVISPRVKYMLNSKEILSNKEQLKVLLDKPDYNLIIINTRIDDLQTINEIKATLHEIDGYVANLEEVCATRGTLLVSSLFGINKEVRVSNISDEKATLNFFGSVPLIVVNKEYNKDDYYLGFGDPSLVLGTALMCCNKDSKYPTLIKKKNSIMKMFSKKKKDSSILG